MVFRVERWCVQPQELPRVWRHCSGCSGSSAFVCSEKFRVNAQKKIIDVWLIYRCCACDTTWNFPVLSRCAVTALEPTLRLGYECNDVSAVRRHAFAIDRLRRYCSDVELGECIVVERTDGATGVACPGGDVIQIAVPLPCQWRLDRLLARELRISRSMLARLFDTRQLTIEPRQRDSLRRCVRDGQIICFVGVIGRQADS
jgi:hypothetical protein